MGLKECSVSEERYGLHDIVVRLTGRINPIGETNTDNERLRNLDRTLCLLDDLLADVHKVARGIDRGEYSISHAGQAAMNWLKEVKSDIEELVG